MSIQLGQMGVEYNRSLEKKKRVEDWAANMRLKPADLGASVTWKWGSGVTGYEDIQKDVERRVAELLPGLITEVVEAARRDADQKLRALTGLAARLDTQLNGERQP